MSLTKRDIQRAEAFGRLAARNRQSIHACPYEANGTPDDRVQAAHFIRAYLKAGGKVAVDYEDGQGATEGNPRYRAATTRAGTVVKVAVLRRPPD